MISKCARYYFYSQKKFNVEFSLERIFLPFLCLENRMSLQYDASSIPDASCILHLFQANVSLVGMGIPPVSKFLVPSGYAMD